LGFSGTLTQLRDSASHSYDLQPRTGTGLIFKQEVDR